MLLDSTLRVEQKKEPAGLEAVVLSIIPEFISCINLSRNKASRYVFSDLFYDNF